MISLITRVQGKEVKQRTSVNNKYIIQMYLGYNLLISQRSTSINASVYNEHVYTMASTGYVTDQSILCTINSCLLYCRLSADMAFLLGDIQYHPDHRVISNLSP